MTIPFTQYLLPHGEKRQGGFDRPLEIEKMAHALIKQGYRFESEILTTGQVSITFVGDDEDGDSEDLCIEISSNGPEIRDAVDKLVTDAHALKGKET